MPRAAPAAGSGSDITQLRVRFPKGKHGRPAKIVTLDRVDKSRANPKISTPAIAIIHSSIQKTEHSLTCRATLSDQAVVLKFTVPLSGLSSLRDLENEAMAYRGKLKPLQGTVVPRYLGLYKATKKTGEVLGCMVLEDCGDAVEVPFCELPLEHRIQILKHVVALHARKCALDDFAEHNVVGRDGQYRLIDFHGLKKHLCECNGDLRLEESILDADDIGCLDLYYYGQEMRVWPEWTPPHVLVGDLTLEIKLYPKQEVIDQLLSDVEPDRLEANAHIVAPWLRRYRKLQNRGITIPVEKYKERRPALTVQMPFPPDAFPSV
ncbi:hypothetical protein PLICRDRAFT_178434 [Plicaturopsis crispa FD-325 SS-3]|nr:hypothetical protein PLICRDRAFT_178434 [Plicaturopsis crispa FD-325 SS-3]